MFAAVVKHRELYWRTMLARGIQTRNWMNWIESKPGRYRIQEESQSNSFVAAIDRSPKFFIKMKVRRTKPYLTFLSTSHVIIIRKGKRKSANRLHSLSAKTKESAWAPEAVELLLKYFKEYNKHYKVRIHRCRLWVCSIEHVMYTEGGRDSPRENMQRRALLFFTLLEGLPF